MDQIQWNFMFRLINNNSNNKMADFLFCFKINYQAKFNKTLQERLLHDPVHKCNKATTTSTTIVFQ